MTTLLSETFTGTNGANWSAVNWDYKFFQFGGIGDIQSNKGRLVTGAIGSGNDYGGYRSAASFTNFRATFDYTVSGTTTTGSYLAVGLRASSVWVSGVMIADACYFLELKRGSPNATFSLMKRLSGATSTLSTAATTFTAGDVIHVKVIADGSSLKVRYWKNAESQPTTWNFENIDTAHTAGKFFITINGGTDTATETFTVDDFLVDDVLTEGNSSPAAGAINAAGTAHAPSINAVDGSTPTLFAETWTGSNGAAWPAQWTTTTSGAGTVIDIQSNKGRMATGTAVYGKVGARNTSALSSTNYTLTVDITIPTYTEWYFFVHVRGANTFSNTYQILSSYQFRFTSYLGATVPELYQVDAAGVATLRAAAALTGTPIAGDVVRIKIEVSGTTTTTLKQKAWIVGASEPSYTDLSASVSVAYTGSYLALSAQGGNNTVSEDFLWDNASIVSPDDGTVDAQTATGVASAGNPNPSVAGFVNAQLASGHGEGHFDAAGGTLTLILEALDAVAGHGEALSAQRQHNAGVATGAGAAFNAGVSVARRLDGAGIALSAGVANNSTVTTSGVTSPSAAVAAGVGVANNATVSSVSASIAAQVALGSGDATGISFLQDENGDPVLDEFGQQIDDGSSLTIYVAPRPTVVTGIAAANSPTTKTATSITAALSVGSAPQPAISATGTGATTNVNAATATASGTATTATATATSTATTATGAGAAETAQTSVTVQAGEAASTGAAWQPDRNTVAESAEAFGFADAAQVDIDANNFASAAAIPIAGSAENPNIHIAVNAGVSAVGVAWPPNQSLDEPGQLITLRDQGHTVTVKER